MELIDKVFGLNWETAQYVGDGVYVMGAQEFMGIPAIALRTDCGYEDQQVIMLEQRVFEAFVEEGYRMLTAQREKRWH